MALGRLVPVSSFLVFSRWVDWTNCIDLSGIVVVAFCVKLDESSFLFFLASLFEYCA